MPQQTSPLRALQTLIVNANEDSDDDELSEIGAAVTVALLAGVYRTREQHRL
jgi:hypothetical protein